jgi:hypothetical protein
MAFGLMTAVVDPLTPPPSAKHVVTPDGEASIWLAAPGVAVQQARGVLSLAIAQLFADFYRPVLQGDARVTIFDDFEYLTHYQRDAREYLTAFTRERLANVRVIHFLLGSKFMALGVGAFKHDVGDSHVRTYADRASFLRSYEAVVAGATRP